MHNVVKPWKFPIQRKNYPDYLRDKKKKQKNRQYFIEIFPENHIVP